MSSSEEYCEEEYEEVAEELEEEDDSCFLFFLSFCLIFE